MQTKTDAQEFPEAEPLTGPDSSERQRGTGYFELVRTNADYRWLWFGQIVSLLGDWFNLIASIALIAALTDSGIAVGSLFVIRMLAPFLTSPVAGVVADRFSRRQVLIATDIIRGVAVAGMLFVRRPEMIWLLYVLTAIQMGTSGFFFTARRAILPDLVDARSLGTANALSAATWSVMLAVGAALGGFAAGWLGIYTAFAIDAGTFLVSALLVSQIRRQPKPGQGSRLTLVEGLRDYARGIRYLVRHPDVFAIALHKVALTLLLGTTFRVVQSAIAERVFPIGEQGGIAMGLMFAAAGLGTGVGPITLRYLIGDDQSRLRLSLLLGYFLGGMGLAISASLWSLPVMLVGAFIAGTGNGVLWVFSTQLLLQLVDQEVRGRVFGTEFALFALGSATGSAIVGVALDSQLGIQNILIFMATLSLLPATAWALWLLHQFRKRSLAERNSITSTKTSAAGR